MRRNTSTFLQLRQTPFERSNNALVKQIAAQANVQFLAGVDCFLHQIRSFADVSFELYRLTGGGPSGNDPLEPRERKTRSQQVPTDFVVYLGADRRTITLAYVGEMKGERTQPAFARLQILLRHTHDLLNRYWR